MRIINSISQRKHSPPTPPLPSLSDTIRPLFSLVGTSPTRVVNNKVLWVKSNTSGLRYYLLSFKTILANPTVYNESQSWVYHVVIDREHSNTSFLQQLEAELNEPNFTG